MMYLDVEAYRSKIEERRRRRAETKERRAEAEASAVAEAEAEAKSDRAGAKPQPAEPTTIEAYGQLAGRAPVESDEQ